MDDKNTEARFLRMLEKHIGIAVKTAGAYVGSKGNRKDLAHDIILELWKSLGRFDGSCKPSARMYRAALNVSMNYKRKRTKTVSFASSGGPGEKDIVQGVAALGRPAELEILYGCIEDLDEINKAISTVIRMMEYLK